MRAIWAHVESLNLTPLYQKIRAVEGVAGRDAVDPKILMALWIFATTEGIMQVEDAGSQVAAPMTYQDRILKQGGDPHARRVGDRDAMAAFRERMKTDEAKARLKQRPSIAEFSNAEFRNRGLQQFPVRGQAKARTISLWHAITFNFMRMLHMKLL